MCYLLIVDNANRNIYNEREETRINQDSEERKDRIAFQQKLILKGIDSRTNQQIHDNKMEALHLSSAHSSANIMHNQFNNSGILKNDAPAPMQTNSSSSSSAVNEKALRKVIGPMLKKYLSAPPLQSMSSDCDDEEEYDPDDWDRKE